MLFIPDLNSSSRVIIFSGKTQLRYRSLLFIIWGPRSSSKPSVQTKRMLFSKLLTNLKALHSLCLS